jgi:hypothetical protein
MSGRRAILFASAPPARAARVLDIVRQRWPDHEWVVCIKDHERGWVPSGCGLVTVPRRRPGLAAFRRLRRGPGVELAVACWSGERGYLRLKALHLTTPARERHVYNDNFDAFELRLRDPEAGQDPAWLRHIRWRYGRPRPRGPASAARLASSLYGATLGPVLGLLWLCGRHALWSLGLGPRAKA